MPDYEPWENPMAKASEKIIEKRKNPKDMTQVELLIEELAVQAAMDDIFADETVSSACGICGVATSSAHKVSRLIAPDPFTADMMNRRRERGQNTCEVGASETWALCPDCHKDKENSPLVPQDVIALCAALSTEPNRLWGTLVHGQPVWDRHSYKGFTREQLAEPKLKGPFCFYDTIDPRTGERATPQAEPASRRFVHIRTELAWQARKDLLALALEKRPCPGGMCSICKLDALPPVGSSKEAAKMEWTTETVNGKELWSCPDCTKSMRTYTDAFTAFRDAGVSRMDYALCDFAGSVGIPGIAVDSGWAAVTGPVDERFKGIDPAVLYREIQALRPQPVMEPRKISRLIREDNNV